MVAAIGSPSITSSVQIIHTCQVFYATSMLWFGRAPIARLGTRNAVHSRAFERVELFIK